MHPHRNPTKADPQMLVQSPRCILNCQDLTIHLPPLQERRDTPSEDSHLISPMSASSTQLSFDSPSPKPHNSRHQHLSTPPSRPSTLGNRSPQSPQALHVNRTLTRDVRGSLSTPSSTDLEASGASLHFSSDKSRIHGDSNDELSSNPQDSPEAQQLIPGAPGTARRAKAHVPSACISSGKEASCVDVQHKKRGRPRLREEEGLRDVNFGSEYPRNGVYQGQAGGLPLPHSGRHRSKTYRELRSQPESPYADHRPRTSGPAFPQQQYLRGPSGYSSPPRATSFLSENIPTVLLTPDFVVAQHNRAFSDALSLSFTARGQALVNLVVPAEAEKIQRLQSLMRAELGGAVQAFPVHSGSKSLTSMPSIEQVDIAHVTAGFRTRSEYWTFRLPREQSRGFPISISFARDGGHFVVLTLVQSTSERKAVQSPASGPNLPSSSAGYAHSPPQQHKHQPRYSHHQAHHQHRHHRNSPSDVGIPYLMPSASSNLDEQVLQLQHSHMRGRYEQGSPPTSVPLPYGISRADSSGSNPDIPRSSPGHHHQSNPRDNLRHLQLPPIRTTPTSDPSLPKVSARRRHQSDTPSPARSSPNSGKWKKRQRVDIEEMLHR